jgi:hypothetical protein
MLNTFFSISEYIYNNLFYYYYIYITIYKYNIYIRFYIEFLYNIFKYYITSNKLMMGLFKPFLSIYNMIRRLFIWTNRRFLKKKKRFRIYYKYHNIRYWKFLLFFFYLYVFFILWKKRNLYTKTQFVFAFIFLHILILISLNFFIGLFNSFDLGFLSCIFFMFLIVLFLRR